MATVVAHQFQALTPNNAGKLAVKSHIQRPLPVLLTMDEPGVNPAVSPEGMLCLETLYSFDNPVIARSVERICIFDFTRLLNLVITASGQTRKQAGFLQSESGAKKDVYRAHSFLNISWVFLKSQLQMPVCRRDSEVS